MSKGWWVQSLFKTRFNRCCKTFFVRGRVIHHALTLHFPWNANQAPAANIILLNEDLHKETFMYTQQPLLFSTLVNYRSATNTREHKLIRCSITYVTPFCVLFLKVKSYELFFSGMFAQPFLLICQCLWILYYWLVFHHFLHFVFHLRQAHHLYFTYLKSEWQETLFSHVVSY